MKITSKELMVICLGEPSGEVRPAVITDFELLDQRVKYLDGGLYDFYIIQQTSTGQYYRVKIYHDSWSASDFSEASLSLVKPVTKEVVDYEINTDIEPSVTFEGNSWDIVEEETL